MNAPFVKGSDTSQMAAEAITIPASQLRARVFAYIESRGATGTTCDEVEHALSLRHQTASARIRELVLEGRVVDSGTRRTTRSGHSATVWIVSDQTEKPAEPFLKWLGGKRQIIPQFQPYLPTNYGRYFEPFMGGAALFFHMRPANATLSDANLRLVRTYRGIRDNVDEVIATLLEMKERHAREGEAFYRRIRAVDVDNFSQDATVAAWFIYLNKAGFNGIYRVNRDNVFNVPFGKNPKATICDANNLRACSQALKGVNIFHRDFTAVANEAAPGDFVYFDPPYVPVSETSSFTSYTADGFGASDQIRLRDLAFWLSQRGVRVLLSNSSAPAVRELYAGARIIEINAARMLSAKVTGRHGVKEFLVVLDLHSADRLTVNRVEADVLDEPNPNHKPSNHHDEQEQEQGADEMANLPADMAAEIGKARVAGGGNYIQHGDYVVMYDKWFYQKIQDRCVILEMIVAEAHKKVVMEGDKRVEQDPNPPGSSMSDTANFDGQGKLSAPANSRAPVLGLFGYKENEVPDATVTATLDECLGPNQPARGMLVVLKTFSKEIQSRKGSYITGRNYECISKPGTGINTPDLVKARLDALAQGPEAFLRVVGEQLRTARANGMISVALGAATSAPAAPAAGGSPSAFGGAAPAAAPGAPAPAPTASTFGGAPAQAPAPTASAFGAPAASAFGAPAAGAFAAPQPTPPAPPAPPAQTPAVDPIAAGGWQPNQAAPDWYYRYVNGVAEQKLKADILAGR